MLHKSNKRVDKQDPLNNINFDNIFYPKSNKDFNQVNFFTPRRFHFSVNSRFSPNNNFNKRFVLTSKCEEIVKCSCASELYHAVSNLVGVPPKQGQMGPPGQPTISQHSSIITPQLSNSVVSQLSTFIVMYSSFLQNLFAADPLTLGFETAHHNPLHSSLSYKKS